MTTKLTHPATFVLGGSYGTFCSRGRWASARNFTAMVAAPTRKLITKDASLAWRRRLQPTTPHFDCRGTSPHRSFAPHRGFGFSLLGALLLRPGGLTTSSLCSVLVASGRWLLCLPVFSQQRFQAYRSCHVTSISSFRLSGIIVRACWQVLRGLGGLVRLKMRYKGKSFKWHRRRGSLLLRFGHSHLTALKPNPGVRWRRLGRMKLVLFGSNVLDLLAFAHTTCAWRPINVYHGRGLRLRRQVVLRKAGKVSAYR